MRDADPHPDPLSIRGQIRDRIRPAMVLQHVVVRCRVIRVPRVAFKMTEPERVFPSP
jgi:hypothetical protein